MTRTWNAITETTTGEPIEGFSVNVAHDVSPGQQSLNAYVTAKDGQGVPSVYMARLASYYVQPDEEGKLCLWLSYRQGDLPKNPDHAEWVHVNLGRFEDAKFLK